MLLLFWEVTIHNAMTPAWSVDVETLRPSIHKVLLKRLQNIYNYMCIYIYIVCHHIEPVTIFVYTTY